MWAGVPYSTPTVFRTPLPFPGSGAPLAANRHSWVRSSDHHTPGGVGECTRSGGKCIRLPALLSEIITLFQKIIDPDSEISALDLSDDPELLAFSATRKFPERKKCASLSWDEMEKLLNKQPFSEKGTK